jgi:hypothetical protein
MQCQLINEIVDKTPYVWWKDGESTLAAPAPFYCLNIPDVQTIQSSGCNCAGLINLLQLSRGLPVPGVKTEMYYAGGTYVWFDYLESVGALEPLDTGKSYPAGSMLLRKYRSPEDQGHVAVLYTGGPLLTQQLLHCYPDAGIKIDSTVQESHDWLPEGYYEYICVNWYNIDLPTPST